MQIALIQVGGSECVATNKERVAELLAQAAERKADLAILPELSVFEFFPRKPHAEQYFELAEPVPGPLSAWFGDLARKYRMAIVFNQYERSEQGLYFDTSVLVDRDGRVVGRQRMMHIAEEHGYNEKFYYAPGCDAYHVLDVQGWRLGIATCYDRHYPEVFRSFILQGANLIAVPTAVAAVEPFSECYELEMRAAAITHGVYIAMANRAGCEEPLQFLGQSMLIDPEGRVAQKLGDDDGAIGLALLDHRAVIQARRRFPFLRDRRPETYSRISQVPED